MAAKQIDVEPLFSMTLAAGDASNAVIRKGPSGTRIVAAVTGGTFEGPRLKGIIVPPGGDWVTARSNRVIQLDVRILLVTDDNESILMTYQGIGTPGDDGVTHLRTAPRFETGAETYAWLNDIQAVGIGTSTDGTVTYDVFALR